MSAKKEMTKRQRLYYEYNNKDKVKEELAELAKVIHEVESKYGQAEYIRRTIIT
jgi:hypothetical protein